MLYSHACARTCPRMIIIVCSFFKILESIQTIPSADEAHEIQVRVPGQLNGPLNKIAFLNGCVHGQLAAVNI